MRVGLVGYTGFVGSNISKVGITDFINSSNILEFENQKFDRLIIAAGDARKWYANANGYVDLIHISKLFIALSRIICDHVVLISTVDVYQQVHGGYVNESTEFYSDAPYGRNRLMLEELIKLHFKKTHIIRLPGLFGQGMKKNLLFDLINNREDQIKTYNPLSEFQFINLIRLTSFVNMVIEDNIPLLNLNSVPIRVADLCQLFRRNKDLLSQENPHVKYDVKTQYTMSGYWFTQEEIFNDLIQLGSI